MRYGIVGAGSLGLTLALRLLQRGHDVEVFERSSVPGGLASSFEVSPGVWLERFYHHLFTSDRYAISLIQEVGLGDDLLWLRPTTTTLIDGRFRQLDSASSLLRFRGLTPQARIRMGAALAVLRALPTPAGLHETPAGAWLRRTMGDEGYERIWKPLLDGKFGASSEAIAMAWLWARVHDRSAKLGYLRGGFHRFYSRLEERVEGLGGEVVTNAAVETVEPDANQLTMSVNVAGASRRERFDRVVSTLPLRITAGLVPSVGPALLARYPPPGALAAHCLVLALDRSLVPAYWVNVNDPGFPFVVAVEHTRLITDGSYGFPAVVYLGRYCEMSDPLLAASAEEVLDSWTPAIQRLNREFDPSWIRASWSFAAPFAQPIVRPGFRDTIPPFETPMPNFFMASMFQVYPHDRGQNQSIRLAERLAERLSDITEPIETN
jgi:protoporphyrinogen oxidase